MRRRNANSMIFPAARVFADDGYTLASTRRLATAEGFNHPALHYYFDSKELHRSREQLLGDMVEPELAVRRSKLPPRKVG